MLKMKPECERCHCSLPMDSDTAMICSFECTFCRSCVETNLNNRCPNCSGELLSRPRRKSKP